MTRKTAMAVGAHPDDIEFMMAGTLLLLRDAGWQTHYLSVASGSCGSSVASAAQVRRTRRKEAAGAARLLGAEFHRSLVDDLQIYYERSTLRRLAALLRELNPAVLLVPSPQDYMEDHTNSCRLAVTAAFVRGMRNFKTLPSRPAVEGDVTVYHAMPHGLRDSLGWRLIPGAFVDTTSVQDRKRAALAEHQSQQVWLRASQHMSEYLLTLERFGREMGRMSRRFRYAEGWRRHLHHGFCPSDADPLRQALGAKYMVNSRYARAQEKGHW